ncbi:helix-turn-helix transcriptional regulator [Klebsiella aerogenes]|nr:helix-turn-helix transcriptional regulator [Klebsiella aerogenes]ELY3087273.1 helix-turn-helix transcriptional regulator [Klebsiella aerogenes]
MNLKESIILSVVDWIEDNLESNPDIESISNKSGYGRRQIQSLFKQQVGVPVGTYIKRRRISKAALLIRLTKKSIFHIAMDLNYSSQQSLSRSFYQAFGCSPLSFRKMKVFELNKLYPRYSPTLTKMKIKIAVKKDVSFYLKGREFEYNEKILGDGFNKTIKHRFANICKYLMKSKEVYIASRFNINNGNKNILKVDGFIGEEKSKVDAEFILESKEYSFLTYQGSWRSYNYFVRHLYMFIDVSRGCGYDVEKIINLSERFNEDSNVQVDIYIPT